METEKFVRNLFGVPSEPARFTDNGLGRTQQPSALPGAQLRSARAVETLKDQESRLWSYLARNYEQTSVVYEQIKANRAEREAFDAQRKARNEEYKAGCGTLDTLLEAQRRWADALNSEYASIVAYNNVLAELDSAKGASLKRHKIMWK